MDSGSDRPRRRRTSTLVLIAGSTRTPRVSRGVLSARVVTVSPMKYVVMIFRSVDRVWTAADDEALQRLMRLEQELAETGELVSSEGLRPPEDGRIVQIRDGQQVVTDGPFGEAKEQLAGFFLIDASTRTPRIRPRGSVGAGGYRVAHEVRRDDLSERRTGMDRGRRRGPGPTDAARTGARRVR